MKRYHKLILTILLLIAVVSAYFFRRMAAFPGKIDTPAYQPEVVDANYSTFREGEIYRHSNQPPLLEVSGTHYEIGLQYGVLLRPEILEALEAYEDILRHIASEEGVPFPILTALLKYRAGRMSARLPERYREEIRGVSEGSGVREDVITAVSLMYDVLMTNGCTGLLMRTADGGVIHGRSQEPYGFGYGGLLGKHTVVVRHKAEGYHAVTHMDVPLFMGVETGYNDQGLAYSEETYSIREPNPDGFPIVYLARLALETSATLEETKRTLGGSSVAAPGGMIWSDRKSGNGMRVELLPAAMAVQQLDGPILWDFNNIVDSMLLQQQHPRTSLAGFNRDREKIAAAFPKKPAYTIRDAVNFLRSRHTADSCDYSRLGNHSSIANAWGQQMVIFDPAGEGFYLALGKTFASLREVYRYYHDFAKAPTRFMEAVPVDPVVEQAARISTGLLSKEERLQAYRSLTQKYPDDAQVHFLTAYESLEQECRDLFVHHAKKADELTPGIGQYQLYAGLAAYHEGNLHQAKHLLKGMGGDGISTCAGDLSPEQQLYRLTVLAKADPDRAAQYELEKQVILENYGAVEYYEKGMLSKLENE